MNLRDLFELSLFAGLVVLLLLMLAGAIRYRPGRMRGRPLREKLRRLGGYVVVRLPISIGFALAVFVLGAAALTLNSHRPPADTDPVLRVPPGAKTALVSLDLADCGEPLTGSLTLTGLRGLAIGPVRFYSDGSGWQRLNLRADGRHAHTRFEQAEPTRNRSLLSCYLQLPVVEGASRGYEVRLELPEEMEVDRDSSVPAPGGYSSGLWTWNCRPGKECPSFAALNYSVEDGTKQVIVLVLASIFGALIALLAGDVLIEWARKRFRARDRSGSGN